MAIPRIPIPTEQLADFCRRNRIRHLGLFGSVLRDDFGPDSDAVRPAVARRANDRVEWASLTQMADNLEKRMELLAGEVGAA